MSKRMYCKYCGAKLKKDICGLICPENHLHENNEENLELIKKEGEALLN